MGCSGTKVNEQVQDIIKDVFGNDKRWVIVDIEKTMTQYDAKHERQPTPDSVVTLNDSWILGNWPIRGNPFFPHAGGGLFEADNLHPSTAGYSLLATQVLKAISATEQIPVRDINLDLLYSLDPNAVFPPLPVIDGVADVWKDYRINHSQHRAIPLAASSDANYNAVIDTLAVLNGAALRRK